MFKFTLSWLKEHLEFDGFHKEKFCEILNNLGLEVEQIIDLKSAYSKLVFAKILDFERHPDAEKLNVCNVFDGFQELQIVCGAPNVKKNMIVVLAPVGTILPFSDIKIKKSKIRGVTSYGMLCSASELSLGNESDGIIEIDDSKIKLGNSIIDFFNLNDVIVELNITPNRGDCLSVLGVARDLHAAGFGKLKEQSLLEIPADFTSDIKLAVDTQNCRAFYLREFKIDDKLKTPTVIQEYLKKIDSKSINCFVDIANYITFDLGIPMHVYDMDKLQNKCLKVQKLNDDQIFKSLKNEDLNLAKEDIVIADQDGKILCLAGIIGGYDCMVDENTTNILLEVGYFEAEDIMRTTQRLIFNSESSKRYARGIDVQMMKNAIHKFTNILKVLHPAMQCSEIINFISQSLSNKNIKIDWLYFRNFIGQEIDSVLAKNILTNLGFLEVSDDNFQVPSWRNDIMHQEDLFEEIVRVFSINNIENKPYDIAKFFAQSENPDVLWMDEVKQKLRSLFMLQMHECITWSFMDSHKAIYFLKNEHHLEQLMLDNPITENLNVMRPTIISNILDAIPDNANRAVKSFAVFEIGKIFEHNLNEREVAVGVMSGIHHQKKLYDDHDSERSFNFFDAKEQVEKTLFMLNINLLKVDYRPIEQFSPVYKNNKSCAIFYKNKKIAQLGELNDNFIRKYYDIDQKTVAFEIFIDNLPKIKKNLALAIQDKKTVALEKDLVFVFDEQQSAFEVLKFIKNLDSIIEKVEVFDIFISPNMQKRKQKSLGFKMFFRSEKDENLIEEHIKNVFNKVIEEVSKKFHAVLRDLNYIDN